jgi:hypothetical protein
MSGTSPIEEVPGSVGRLVHQDGDAAGFVRARRYLDSHRGLLVERASSAYARDLGTGLRTLSRPGWLPSRPLDARRVFIRLRNAAPDEGIGFMRVIAAKQLALLTGSRRYSDYSAAITAFDPPPVWFNGPSYRLLRVTPELGGVDLEVSAASYFDGQDTAEVLALEAAARSSAGESDILAGPIRQAAGGPFAFSHRYALVGVNVLTIRSGTGPPSFFLHRRSPTGASPNAAVHHVIPAGELQPSIAVFDPGTDLKATIAREYVEEFLGESDDLDRGTRETRSSFERGFTQVLDAIGSDAAQLWYLGIGLDPLTWKPEVFFTCVWPEDLFDSIFSGMVASTHEGVIVNDPVGAVSAVGGIALTARNVDRYLSRADIFPGAHSCLALAWRWRRSLGLADS